MSENLSKDAQAFEELHRRFLSVWQAKVGVYLDGIGMSEFRAMVAVGSRGSATMSEISRTLGLTLGAATGVVDRLVDAGHVVRQHDPTDRRVVKVELTPSGKQTMEKVTKSMVSHMESVLTQTTPEEREGFLGVYGKIVNVSEADHAARTAKRPRVM